MKWSEGRMGRIFVISLEDNDRMPEAVEKFCKKKSLLRGLCFFTGGIKSGNLVVGPAEGEAEKTEPVVKKIAGVHEMSGAGAIFPDGEGFPRLHMHASLGRGMETLTGCIRKGLNVWKLGEAVVLEIDNCAAARRFDPDLGLSILEP